MFRAAHGCLRTSGTPCRMIISYLIMIQEASPRGEMPPFIARFLTGTCRYKICCYGIARLQRRQQRIDQLAAAESQAESRGTSPRVAIQVISPYHSVKFASRYSSASGHHRPLLPSTISASFPYLGSSASLVRSSSSAMRGIVMCV